MKPKNPVLLAIIPFSLIACGTGQNDSVGNNYYSASGTTYYQIESVESQLNLNIVTTSGVASYPLTTTAANAYTFASGSTTGTVTLENNNLGISFNNPQSTWIDFATQNIRLNTIPDGTYNLICDQSNLSACQASVLNNAISIIEYSVTGQSTQLCQNSPITSANVNFSPSLFQFNCGVNGGSSSGTWYALPITIESTTGIMLNEYNPTTNTNNDETDEIAFPNSSTINPSGTYYYLYNGGAVSSGVGTSTAQFTSAGLINQIVGLCSGAACALIKNQYYNNMPAIGFDWYNANGMNNYNLVGNDSMGIYQDSFEGFYY